MSLKQKLLGTFFALTFLFGFSGVGAQSIDFNALTRAQLIEIISNLIMQLQSNYQFENNFSLGSEGQDIKELQKILNEDPETQVASSGNGSSGNETEYFGNLTKNALIKYQNKHSLTASGVLDEETRFYLNKRGISISYTPDTPEQNEENPSDSQEAESEDSLEGSESENIETITINDLGEYQSLSGVISSSSPFITGDAGYINTASYKLEAINDKFILKNIQVSIENASVISEVYLTVGNKVIASRPGGNSIIFEDINFEIPINGIQTFNVVVKLSAVGSGKGQTGSNIKTSFVNGKAISEATGQEMNFIPADGSINAIDIYVYGSTPKIILEDMPNVSFTPGTMIASRFRISADDSGDITWKRLTWDINKTEDISITNPVLYKNNNAIVGTFSLSTGLRGTDGSATSGTIEFLADSEQYVPAGGYDLYELKFDVQGSVGTGDYISTNISMKSSYEAPTDFSSITGASFVWSDTSASGHSYNTDDWMNDYLVKNLPTDEQTLSY